MQVGTSNLVTHAVKSRTPRFVLVSSTAVYGNAPGPWAETSQTLPTDPYGTHPSPARLRTRHTQCIRHMQTTPRGRMFRSADRHRGSRQRGGCRCEQAGG